MWSCLSGAPTGSSRETIPIPAPVRQTLAKGPQAPEKEPLPQPRSSAIGVETVRSLALMLMAAVLTSLVLMTQRLMESWAGDDLFLGWTVLWCVMLASLLWVSRLANGVARHVLAGLDAWAWRRARERAAQRQRVQQG